MSENILSEPRFHPPIVPLVAFNNPAFVTLKGAEAKVAWPNWIPSSASAIKTLFKLPSDIFLLEASNVKLESVDTNVLPLIVNPAITPPVSNTSEPVICPLFFNIKLLFELLIAVALIPNPPIVPAVAFNTPPLVTLKGASENVASPNWIPVSASAMNISSPLPSEINLLAGSSVKFVAVIVLGLIVNPPIVPSAAFIEPLIFTLPSLSRWNDEALISILPFDPLIKAVDALPKKNCGVSMLTPLPLRVVSPELCIFNWPFDPLTKLVMSPKKKFEALIIKLLLSKVILLPSASPIKTLPVPSA